MKIYNIYDEDLNGIAGVLLYYEKSRTYIIELVEGLDEWTAPLLLTAFVRKNIFTISREASFMWVKQRVIPPGRQNIQYILKNHHMKEYDEMRLLELSQGRCSQDNMHIEKISELPDFVAYRQEKNLSEVVCLKGHRILCFFNDKTVKVADLRSLGQIEGIDKVLENEQLYQSGRLIAGGYALSFNDSIDIPAYAIYEAGQDIPLSSEDFNVYVESNLVDTGESCILLECSRQNLSYLLKKKRIHAVKDDVKGNLYLKGNILRNTW